MTEELKVRIVQLEPMRVASAVGFGVSPEEKAWRMMGEWIDKQGYPKGARFFGFNNPHPTPGDPNYGYEQWMTVGTKARPDGGVDFKECEGGLYAVARCQGLMQIGEIWQELFDWCERNDYQLAGRQNLEECLSPELFIPWSEDPSHAEKLLSDANFDLMLAIQQ